MHLGATVPSDAHDKYDFNVYVMIFAIYRHRYYNACLLVPQTRCSKIRLVSIPGRGWKNIVS